VSVRSAAEAGLALAGGAALVDVKEPGRGSLGRADDATIAAVAAAVAGRRPVSAALGELRDDPNPPPGVPLDYVKWGLAGLGAADWRRRLLTAAEGLRRTHPATRPVAAAYADWRRAAAPPFEEVVGFALSHRWPAFLVDTWDKDGTTLLDWLPRPRVIAMCRLLRRAGVAVALAGSLRREQIAELMPAQPDWFAVRGAACREGRRGQALDGEAVRALVQALASPLTRPPAATPGS
jgi:uncharacterized protein (UPF0264 family)